MAIENIGLTAALSQMAQEQMKQKIQNQEAQDKANTLAQALLFRRDLLAQQQAQMAQAAKQHQDTLANQLEIAKIGYNKALDVQGMKGKTAQEIAAQKAADKKAGIDPQFNNLMKFQGIWKEKGVENLKSPQAQEELLAGIESGTYDPIDAQALISNPYWSIDKTRHDAFEAKKNKVLGLSTAPTTQTGGALLTGGMPVAEGDTPTVEDFKGLPAGKALQDNTGGVWILKNGVPTKVR